MFNKKRIMTKKKNQKKAVAQAKKSVVDTLRFQAHWGLKQLGHEDGNMFHKFVDVEVDFIADHMIRFAKSELNNPSLSVSQVATRLGFEYPQHFVRFFKRRTGITPKEYRKSA